MDLEELLSECIDLLEQEGAHAVNERLALHPDLADEARRILMSLRGMGLVGQEEESAASTAEDPLIGRTLGDYRIVSKLGAGGMGVVYLARQLSVERLAAIKVAHPSLASNPIVVERFRREARSVAKLRHPHIVTIYGSGEDLGVLYTAMEYVAGRSLHERIVAARQGQAPLAVNQALRWYRDLARALAHAHAEGVIHRDVKPSNILIAHDDRAMLLDFGLAKDGADASLTRTGSFQGSPHYASPEQVAAGRAEIGPATDVYSLGIAFYETVSGALPFSGDTTDQIFHQILSQPAMSVRRHNPALSRDLETIVHKAIQRDPEDRYPTAARLADDIDALMAFQPIWAQPPGLVQRLRQRLRRHRVASTIVVMAAVAAVLLPIGLVWQRKNAAQARRAEARAAIRDARLGLSGWAGHREAALALETEVEEKTRAMTMRYASPDEWATLDGSRQQVRRQRAGRDDSFTSITKALDHAAELDPEQDEIVALRTELTLERWRVAMARGDDATARYFQEKILASDPGERALAELAGRAPFRLVTNPAGADVWLFRYEEQATLVEDGEPRLVAVPHPAPVETSQRPGAWCLRVIEPVPPIAAGDVIVSVAGAPIEGTLLVDRGHGEVLRLDRWVAEEDHPTRTMNDVDRSIAGERIYGESRPDHGFTFERGGRRFSIQGRSLPDLGVEVTDPRHIAEQGDVAAVVFRDGELLPLVLPRGLTLRTTASPLFVEPERRVGNSPVDGMELPRGAYVVLVRRAGYEELRIPFDIEDRAGVELEVDLIPEEIGPAGFLPIVTAPAGVPTPFWIMEHETTFGEYLEFVNDPEIRARIDAAGGRVLVPRDVVGSGPDGHLTRAADGAFGLPARWGSDYAVFGVTYDDAVEYARWLTRRSEGWVFRVPTLAEFDAVRRPSRFRRYVSGAVYRPGWVKSQFSSEVPRIEPILRYPIDELPPGVFDLAGGVREHCEDLAFGFTNLRHRMGGSWSQNVPTFFELTNSDCTAVGTPRREIGFRLVARRSD